MDTKMLVGEITVCWLGAIVAGLIAITYIYLAIGHIQANHGTTSSVVASRTSVTAMMLFVGSAVASSMLAMFADLHEAKLTLAKEHGVPLSAVSISDSTPKAPYPGKTVPGLTVKQGNIEVTLHRTPTIKFERSY
jgi:hypothetical protein